MRKCMMIGAIIAGLLPGSPALAWDADVYIDRLDDYFYVSSSSGGFPTWTTLKEGLYADSGPGGIPVSYAFQNWDGANWPSSFLTDDENFPGIFAQADIDHDGTTDEFFEYAEAFVFGDIDPNDANTAYGAGWAYDFELVIPAFSSATVFLDSDGTYGYLESEPGDEGVAFAGIRLYSFDVDINDPGGVNNPYDSDLLSLISPPTGGISEGPLGLSHEFVNNTASPVTYNLRLAGTVSVFEVPEPATMAFVAVGGIGLLTRRRWQIRPPA